MIEINIRKRIKIYNGSHYIGVNTSFHSEANTQISGPSGAGKTTLLKAIAGLIIPEEGYIKVKGEAWLDTRKKICLPPQERNVGFVFQDYALFPNMTVEQHLRYGTKDSRYIERLLSIGKLEAFRAHKPGHLSGGQQQRVAILRALSTRPSLMLMDEPFSALDSQLKNSLSSELKSLLQELNCTCLLVTHYPQEIDGFADHSYELS